MDKRLRIAGIAAAVAFSIFVLASPSKPLPLPDPSATRAAGASAAVLATGLDNPRSIAFAGGDVLVAEKGGAVRVVRDGAMLGAPLVVLRAADGFSAGLLGIEAHPGFGDGSPYVYAYHTYEGSGGELFNKVLRLYAPGGGVSASAVLVDGIPGSRFSNGGAMAFGPDGMLYVGTGSVSDSLHLAQDPSSLAGKILRMDAGGGVPPDNPSPGSYVYASGLRDPQGLAWDADGRMYASDTGPSKNDEINIVVPGANYGWPEYECSDDHPPGYSAAAACFDPAIGPGGLAV